MDTRTLRRTGEQVSLLGFGCMRLPLLRPGMKKEIDYPRAQEMIDCAWAQGVNYYDTAYTYHMEASEAFIGQTLKKYPRDSYFLADKMPTWLIRRPGDGPRFFEEQFRRTGVEYFDFYLCHALGNTDTEFADQYEKTGIFDYLLKQKEAGRFRRFGFSFHGTPERLTAILDRYDWDFVQIQLNYLDWEAQNIRALYGILEARGIQFIVMEPLRGGNLVTLCDAAKDMLKAARPQSSIASWGLRYAASLPNVLCVLSGMSALEQVKDNVSTMSGFEPLSEGERAVLRQALEAYIATGAIPCTGCRYCMDCPAGVDIPGVFSVYNECATTLGLPAAFNAQAGYNKNAGAFRAAYGALPESAQAHNCVTCGQCAKACPQGIDIPGHMKRIADMANNVRLIGLYAPDAPVYDSK